VVAEILIIPDHGALDLAKAGAQYIARSLGAIGVRVRESVSLCNDRKKLQQAISVALERSNTVLIVGGMDRSDDFPAKTVVARGLGLPLWRDDACLAAIKAYCSRTGEPFLAGDEAYADLPEGAVSFVPAYGKAPGCAISSDTQHILLLPESPQELAAMFGRYVTPYLGGAGAATTVTHVLRTYGVGEADVREKLRELTATANPAVTVQQDGNEVIIRVSAHGNSGQEAAGLCAPVLREAARRMGDLAYGLDVDSIQSAVALKMKKKDLGLAIAEAGTDGMLTRILSETVGGPEILRYSITADEDEQKLAKLDVSPKLLKKRGGVSEYAAVAMAAGARNRAEAEIGVGIAANVNDFEDKHSDPGLVYIAVCDEHNVYVKRLVVGDGDVEEDIVIDAAISRTLNMIRLFVDYLPGSYKGCIPLEAALSGKTITDHDSYDEDCAGEDAPSPSRLRRFFDHFVIRKADEPKTKVKKFVLVLAILTFLGCGGYLGLYYVRSYEAMAQQKELQALYVEPEAHTEAVDDTFPGQYLKGFGPLWSINNDIVGYLTVEGTGVGYPVVQGDDNEHYLRRDFYGEQSQHGIPFMDYRVDIGRPSDNFVIYGHNMEDGQIFGELLGYKKLDFFKAHPTILFDTLYEEGEYVVFAVFLTSSGEDAGTAFAYHDFINAKTDQDFTAYVEQLKLRSLLDTGVDAKPGDTLLTLSTCTSEFADARFVIAARKLREGEDPAALTSAAKMNPDPLYPDIWYETFGGQKPDVLGDVNVVTTPMAERSSSAPVISEMAVAESAPAPSLPLSSEEVSASMMAVQTSRVEAQKLAEEQAALEASRLAAEQAASEAEVSRLASEAEVSRLASEAEVSRLASEAEVSRLASEAEVSRLAAEKAASEAEASRLAAEQAAREAQAIVTAHETDAATAASKAATAAKKASSAAKAAENTSSLSRAEKELETAYLAAMEAESYAEEAAQSAEKAGTDAAAKSMKAAMESVEKAEDAFDRAEAALLLLMENDTGESSVPSKDTASSSSTDDTISSASSASGGDIGTLTVTSGGRKVTGDAFDIVSRVVQNEVGSSFHVEAIKAQAVAAYSFILQGSQNGGTASVLLASSASNKVKNAVAEVLGEYLTYNGRVAFTPYHATSAGATTSSQAVWGGSYPYLVSVDSSIEVTLSGFQTTTRMSRQKVEGLLSSKLGITADGDPADWFEILSEDPGGYNGEMAVCGQTRSRSGSKITGRLLRESVLGLRSACFTVDYDDSGDQFIFTTYGYGHGVGMSQNGANLYASQEGWNYEDILMHYYPGTSLQW
jgi:SrtB family sortase